MFPGPQFIKDTSTYKYLRHTVLIQKQKFLDRIADRIFHHPPVSVPSLSTSNISIHILTNRKDWRLAAWSVVTFLTQLKKNIPVIIHDDGTLTTWQAERLQTLLPGSQIVWRKDADNIVLKALHDRPMCKQFRNEYNNSIKLFDPWLVVGAKDIFTLDSDLLFFRRPTALIEWMNGKREKNLWNEDVQTAYTLTAEEIQEYFNIKIIPKINSGLGAVSGKSFDLDILEHYLSHPNARSHHWRIEQTGYAILSCNYGAELLDKSYLISLAKNLGIIEHITARHYVGAVRTQMYIEGMKFLEKQGFLNRKRKRN
jgi:hypothetical protein